MSNVQVNMVDANTEILARIVKATARKYDCSMQIDFTEGRREANFIGNNLYKPFIAEEVENIFRKE